MKLKIHRMYQTGIDRYPLPPNLDETYVSTMIWAILKEHGMPQKSVIYLELANKIGHNELNRCRYASACPNHIHQVLALTWQATSV